MMKFYNHEFYTAIMNEDLDHIEDLTNKHGSNVLIPILDTAPGSFRKVKKTPNKKKCSLPFIKMSYGQKNVFFSLKQRFKKKTKTKKNFDCKIFGLVGTPV